MMSLSRFLVLSVTLTLISAPAFAQEPQSAAPARELAQLLQAQKLDSIATKLPDNEDEFAAALMFPGQMIVVWGKFTAPAYINEKILKREYREAYIDLNSASVVETRHFVTDIGADGIRKGERDEPADSHDVGNKVMRFDGDWREDKMSEDAYNKAHAEADAAYSKVLQALVAKVKAPS
jgi:hypothetical protein